MVSEVREAVVRMRDDGGLTSNVNTMELEDNTSIHT